MRFHLCFDKNFPSALPYLEINSRESSSRVRTKATNFLSPNIIQSKEFRFRLILISVINKLSEKEEQLARYDRVKKLDFSASIPQYPQ